MAVFFPLMKPKPILRQLCTCAPFPCGSPPINFAHTFRISADRRDIAAGRAAHALMILSGFTPSIFISNLVLQFYATCFLIADAHNVFDRMPHRDTVSWNAMVTAYAKAGHLPVARTLFHSIPAPDVVSWNSLIAGYSRSGSGGGGVGQYESIGLFLQMVPTGTRPDRATFALVLKSCAAVHDCGFGAQIHGFLVKFGLVCDVVAGSSLLDMYAKCGRPDYSLRFFDAMPERNWVSWSAVIAGCIQNEMFLDGLGFFKEMLREGVGVNQSVYASVFRACGAMNSLEIGTQVHCHTLKTNFTSDIIVGTATLDMYTKNGSLHNARRVFESLQNPTLQSWNAIIIGFARNEHGFEALELFKWMNKSAVGIDDISLSGILSACAEVKGYLQGVQMHGLSIKTSYIIDVCVGNAILDMYGKCNALAEALRIFEEMGRRDVVSWNAIITALEQNGQYEEAHSHFDRMLSSGLLPDEFTYGSVLKACAAMKSLDSGVKIHDKVIKSGLGLRPFTASTLIDMYCKCGAIEEAQKLHNRLEENHTTVSWNTFISGFSVKKESDEALKLFFQMLDMGLQPDNFTYATILDICANLATVSLGKQIHAQIIKQELVKDVYVSSTLVDMYAKCGNMEDSFLMFSKMTERDFVSWNALICGYSQHGHGTEALQLFKRMEEENVRPNHATFIAVLRACGHVGLCDEGERCFRSMIHRYKLEPELEHYSCMVDLIGRSRGAHAALNLIEGMPCAPDAVIWRSLLSICKIHRDVGVAEVVVKNLLRLDAEDSSAYVLLCNIYSEVGKWEGVSRIRKIMRQNGLKKEPGCSWIEIKNEMHAFLVGDKAHPNCNEIYEILDMLIGEMVWSGYVPDIFSAFYLGEKVYQQDLLAIG